MENFPIYILYSFQKSEILPNAMLKVITCMGGASDINMWTTDGFWHNLGLWIDQVKGWQNIRRTKGWVT